MDLTTIKEMIVEYLVEKNELTDYKLIVLNRYIKLIEKRVHNLEVKKYEESIGLPFRQRTKFERHHILPKSIFPEYKSFIKFEWNSAYLTLKEHYITHLMLYYIFKGKMTFALMHMCKGYKDNVGRSRLYEQCRAEYFNSDEFMQNSVKGAQIVADKLKLGMRIYYDNDGESYGMMYDDDIRIKEFDLSLDKKSDQMIAQRERRSDLARVTNLGTLWYNNGIITKKFKNDELIPEGWIKGGLPRHTPNKIKKYDWTIKENIDRVLTLLIKHNGVLSDVGSELGISGTNVLKNMRQYMPNIKHTDYWIPKKRYKVDKDYALQVYNEHEGDFEKISITIGSNVSSVKEQYEKLWHLT